MRWLLILAGAALAATALGWDVRWDIAMRGNSYYSASDGSPPTPDLTMVGAFDHAQFEKLIESGYGLAGRKLGLMSLVAPDRFPSLSDSEVDSLYLFLQSLASEPAPAAFWRP